MLLRACSVISARARFLSDGRMRIEPDFGLIRPMIILARVDLPLPFGPVIEMNSPSLMVRFMSCKIFVRFLPEPT